MVYSIEVTFNILKNNSVTETQENVKNLAITCNCNSFYTDYEFEQHLQYNRNHCLMTINFENLEINCIIDFLQKCKLYKELYIESIYNDESNIMIYASKYYRTQQMIKSKKGIKIEKNYTENDTKIINEMQK